MTIESSIRAGAHFRRSGGGRAPVFVPAVGGPAEARAPDRPTPRTHTGGDARDEGLGHDPTAEARHGRGLHRAGRFDDLADFAEDLERHAWRSGDPTARALARVLAGTAALEQGRLVFARMRFAGLDDLSLVPLGRALPLVRASRVGLGRTALASGSDRQALQHFRSALAGRGSREDDPALTAARRGLGEALGALGCPESASTELRRALRRARTHGDLLETVLSLSALVRVEAARPGAGGDRRLPRLAASAARLTESPLARIEVLRARAARRAAGAGAPPGPGGAARTRPDGASDEPGLRRALEDLRGGLAVALQVGAVLRQARIERDAAAVLEALGRPDDAEDRRTHARELLARGGRHD